MLKEIQDVVQSLPSQAIGPEQQYHAAELIRLLTNDAQYIQVFDLFTLPKQVEIFYNGFKLSAFEIPFHPGTKEASGPIQWVGHRFPQTMEYYEREWGKVLNTMPKRQANRFAKPPADPNVAITRKAWKDAITERDEAFKKYSEWIEPVKAQLESLEAQLKTMYSQRNQVIAPLDAKVRETREAFQLARQ